MKTYVEELVDNLENKSIKVNSNSIANGLRFTLGDEKIKEIFDDLFINKKFVDRVNSETEYNYFWLASKLIEIDKVAPSADGLKYPGHGWVSGEMWYPLLAVSEQINRLNGVSCSDGVVYPEGSCYNTKGYWDITFDTIEDFNHFLWAGCYRYLPFSKSEKWRILPDLGDPDYNEKKLKMELHYNNLNAKKDEIEKDFFDLAKCFEDYANDEKEINITLGE